MKHYRPKRWTARSALEYAITHVRGYNADAVGRERSERGNVAGATRLCAWALTRGV